MDELEIFLMNLRICRLPAVLAKTGDGRSSHYVKVRGGLFTKPILIGANASGWPQHEIDAIIAARIAGYSDDQLRQLVRDLMAKRITLLDEIMQGGVNQALAT